MLAANSAEKVSTSPTAEQAPLADGSGWISEPSERLDFFHRIRTYPPDVAEWRKRMVTLVAADRDRFPLVPSRASTEDVRSLVDEGVTYLREVARLLALLHGTPSLGNKKDPVDELVYIVLSRKTPEEAYQRTFAALKEHFGTWDDLLKAPRATVKRLVRSGGLADKKTDSLFGALGKLHETFGKCTLEPARAWSDLQLEEFLCSLPELHRKSAYCIMMYSFGRQVFPVDTHVGRVLSRLGPYRELGLDLSGLDHKQLQAALVDLVPPNLRYSLHVNLVSHGREVCRSVKPLCDRCDIKNFCQTFRRSESARIESSGAPTVLDLFCGAGGLSEGFTRAGFRVLAAVDKDAPSLRTYRFNNPGVPDDRILERDIREVTAADLRQLTGRQKIDVLIGAPPCQGFSQAGFRSKLSKTGYSVTSDARNDLFEEMVRIALELKPRLFLMENVPGMQSARRENVSFLDTAAQMLQKKGNFKTAVWKLNAFAFGVPQDRTRYFLAASRDDLPGQPIEEYQDLRRHDLDVDALPPITLHEALLDLPARKAGCGFAVEKREQRPVSADFRHRRYLLKFGLLSESRLLYNHGVRYHNARDLELYSLLQPGEDSVHAIERYGRRDLMRYRKDVFDDKYARLRGDRPSKTIVSHLAKDGNSYIHPDQVRSITVREAARIQSFQDGYVFCGSPSDQWVQVGNSVPPVLAQAIAQSFLRVINRGASR
jgi:DNA (cytosine-5)-methyltransferase 1